MCDAFKRLKGKLGRHRYGADPYYDIDVQSLRPGYLMVNYRPQGWVNPEDQINVSAIWHLDSRTGEAELLYLFSGVMSAAITSGENARIVLLTRDTLMAARVGEPMQTLTSIHPESPSLSDLAERTATLNWRAKLEVVSGTLACGNEVDSVFLSWGLRLPTLDRIRQPALMHRQFGVVQQVTLFTSHFQPVSWVHTENAIRQVIANAGTSHLYALDSAGEVLRVSLLNKLVEHLNYRDVVGIWSFPHVRRMAFQQRDGCFTYMAI
jgi:hypothetical protein